MLYNELFVLNLKNEQIFDAKISTLASACATKFDGVIVVKVLCEKNINVKDILMQSAVAIDGALCINVLQIVY
jgi:hypothetical protein